MLFAKRKWASIGLYQTQTKLFLLTLKELLIIATVSAWP